MKKIVCIALAACFVVALVSFSSSADVVNDVTPISITSVFLADINNGSYHYLTRNGDTFSFTEDLGVSTPTPLFSSLQFHFSGLNYKLPAYSGRALSLSFNIDFDVIGSRYLDLAPSGSDILYSCIFNGAYIYINFTDGTSTEIFYDTFLLRDDDRGDVIDWNSADYWNSVKGGNFNFDISVLFDVTPYLGKTFNYVTIVFPGNNGRIYYSNDDLNDYLVLDDINVNLDFAYTPFNDVVQDDLTDIKTQLGTIDQDVNRVQQDVSDLKDSIEDFQQDLTTPNTDISSNNSQLQDKITDVQDQISSIEKEVNDAVDNVLDKVPGAENPFVGPDVPVLGDIWAKQFIDELWGFIKSYSILFTFIHTGLLFCLASFILRR